MIGKMGLSCLAMLGLLFAAPAPARATLPPPTPPEYGAYGPRVLCEGDLSIAVRADEAVHLVGPIFRIIGDDHLIAATPMLMPPSALSLFDGPVRHGVFATGGLPNNPAIAFRYSGDLPPAAAPYAIFARDGFGKEEVRYAIETRVGAASSPEAYSRWISLDTSGGSSARAASEASKRTTATAHFDFAIMKRLPIRRTRRRWTATTEGRELSAENVQRMRSAGGRSGTSCLPRDR